MKATVTALALALTVVGASTADAAAISFATLPGTTYRTSGIADFSANSKEMDGMQITAFWTVGGVGRSETQTWDGGVNFTGSNFDLIVNGNTINSDWRLDFELSGAGLLQKLVFNGVPGNTVFDRTFIGISTPGSSFGRDLEGFDGYSGRILATYVDQVAVGNDAPVGDIFAGLEIDFLTDGGLGESHDWRFTLDTDIANSPLEGPRSGALETVPEPASMVLLGTGLLGIVALARRHARRS